MSFPFLECIFVWLIELKLGQYLLIVLLFETVEHLFHKCLNVMNLFSLLKPFKLQMGGKNNTKTYGTIGLRIATLP